MKLLVLCPHFAPDPAPDRRGDDQHRHRAGRPGPRAARRHLAAVVPAPPRRAGLGRARLVRHEDTDWGRITRVHPFPTDKRNIPARAAAFAGFTVLSTGLGAGRPPGRPPRRRAGHVAAADAGRRRLAGGRAAGGVPFVFNIQDVFPDVAVELGAITNPRVIRLASWLERWSYRRSDAVTVLSDDLRDNVVAKIRGTVPDAHDRIRVIPNFVDTDRIRPATPTTAYRRRVRARPGKRVVMYAGNVGFSQSLDLLLDAAAPRRAARPADVVFVVNGGGSARARARGAGGGPRQRALRRLPAQGAAPRGAGRGRRPRRAAAAGPGPVERAVEDVLDPGRGPAGRGQRRRGHRGGPDGRGGRGRAGRAARRPRRRSPRPWSRCSDDPAAARAMGRGRPGVRRGAGRRRPRSPSATRRCSRSCVRVRRLTTRIPSDSLMGKASSSKKVARAARAGGRSAGNKQRNLLFPGVIGVIMRARRRAHRLRRQRPQVRRPTCRPSLGDHWHAAFGVYICDAVRARHRPSSRAPSASTPTATASSTSTRSSAGGAGENATLGSSSRAPASSSPTPSSRCGDESWTEGEQKCGDEDGELVVAQWKDVESTDEQAGADPPRLRRHPLPRGRRGRTRSPSCPRARPTSRSPSRRLQLAGARRGRRSRRPRTHPAAPAPPTPRRPAPRHHDGTDHGTAPTTAPAGLTCGRSCWSAGSARGCGR